MNTLISKAAGVIFIAVLMVACNSKPKQQVDTANKPTDSTQVLQVAHEVLTALSQKDYEKLSAFFHPQGVRFSPYAYIDTVGHIRLTGDEFVKKWKDKTPLLWGAFDGTGDPIKFTVEQYIDRFSYGHPYLKAEKVSYNQFQGSGNSLNNLKEVYPNTFFVEFYFPGFNKELGGLDWACLRLVFREVEDKLLLVGVVNDQWTI